MTPESLREAEQELRRRLERDPRDDHAATQLAALLLHQERFGALTKLAEAQAVLYPASAIWQTRLGRSLCAAGEAERGFAVLEGACEGCSESDEAWSALVDAHIERGQFEQALEVARRALAREPQAPERKNLVGVALYRTGAYDEAVEVLSEAIADTEDPARRAVLLMHRANALDMAGEIDAAIEGYEEARATDPECVMATLNLGVTLVKAGRTHDALAPLSEAEILGVTEPRLVRVYGLALHAERRHREAVALAERTLDRDPANGHALLTLGRAKGALGQAAEAAAALRHALAFEPRLEEAAERLSVLLAEQEDFAGAQEVLVRGIACHPANATLRYNAASLARKAGDLDDARAHAEAGLAAEPAHIALRLLATAIAEDQGDVLAARAHLEAAIACAARELPVPPAAGAPEAGDPDRTGPAEGCAQRALATLDPPALGDVRLGRARDGLIVGIVGQRELRVTRLADDRFELQDA